MSRSDGAGSEISDSSKELELLANALRAASADGHVESRHRRAIRQLCHSAAQRPEMPERLLVEFKRLLVDAANHAQLPPGPDRDALLARMASIFIEEFYTVERPHPDGEDGHH